MKRLVNLFAAAVSIISGHIPGWLVVVMTFLVMWGVLTRYVMRQPFGGADELSAFLLVVISFMGLAYAWKERGHIRISFFVKLLPVRVARWLRLITLLVNLACTPVLCWAFYALMARSWELGSKSIDLGIPLELPQIFMFFGITLLFFWLLLELVKAVKAIRSREGGEI